MVSDRHHKRHKFNTTKPNVVTWWWQLSLPMCNRTVVNYNSFIYYRIITRPAWFTANCDLLIGTQILRPIDKSDLLPVPNILAIVFDRWTMGENFHDVIAPRKSFCESESWVKVLFDILMVFMSQINDLRSLTNDFCQVSLYSKCFSFL